MKTLLFTRQYQRYAMLQHLYRTILLVLLVLFASSAMAGDSAMVKLQVIDKSNNEAIPFANVVAYQDGVQVNVGTTNMDGEFIFRNLPPGKYDFKAVYVGYQAQEIKGVNLAAGRTSTLSLKLSGSDILTLCYVTCCCYCGNYYDDKTENWWPKLWTPYREMYKEWKEKKERKLARKAMQKKQTISQEEPIIDNIASDSIPVARDEQSLPIEKEIKIYPNPSSGVVYIESGKSLQNLSVMNEEGKTVKEIYQQGFHTEINLQGLSNGMYYIAYVDDGIRVTKKIVLVNE